MWYLHYKPGSCNEKRVFLAPTFSQGKSALIKRSCLYRKSSQHSPCSTLYKIAVYISFLAGQDRVRKVDNWHYTADSLLSGSNFCDSHTNDGFHLRTSRKVSFLNKQLILEYFTFVFVCYLTSNSKAKMRPKLRDFLE